MIIKSEWKSTKPNPEEEHLKKILNAEIDHLTKAFKKSEDASKQRLEKTKLLFKASGMEEEGIKRFLKEDLQISKEALRESEPSILKPAFDIEALHKQDLEMAKATESKLESPGNPHWHGYIWNPAYGGGWWDWNGESQEIPNITFNVGGKRFDPRVQAWGGGWYDSDHSRIHGYLAFTFNPPSWGRLVVYTYYWLHGYYNLYSNDTWYKSENARAEVDTWVDLHQNFWRTPQYWRRFTMAGDELHPTRYGRIDGFYSQIYATDVGQSDTVTIRAGVRLYSQAKANGGRSMLNFQAESANYVYIPYVYWYLYR